jgi:hypothetical protein
MRNTLIVSAFVLGGLFAFSTGAARAQSGYQFGPLSRPGLYPAGTPGLSPYLDLTRGGNRATNYFLGTIPEIERRRNAAVFGSAILDLERRSTLPVEPAIEELVPTLPQTGHPVAFMNSYPYYLLGPQAAQPAQPGRAPGPAQPRTR